MATDIFARIEHSRTADEVVHQIEVLVLEGILRVGDRLPGERELAKQFDVSRPILRDALKALDMALRGETDFDHLFADLIDREPQLPEHLRDQHKTKA